MPRQPTRGFVSVLYVAFSGLFTVRNIPSVVCQDDTQYDFRVLDPHSAFGSPYGGFGRHVRSTLSSLPLILPDIIDDEGTTITEPFYMELRDDSGKPFVCRSYREDELDPVSLQDGMFVPPVFREPTKDDDDNNNNKKKQIPAPSTKTTTTTAKIKLGTNLVQKDKKTGAPSKQPHHSTTTTKTAHTKDATSTTGSATFSNSGTKSSTGVGRGGVPGETAPSATNAPTRNGAAADATSADADSPTSTVIQGESDTTIDPSIIVERLQQLDSICGQVHKGWWSYEWCHQGLITQFHIDYDQTTNKLEIESVTELGSYHSRTIILDLSTHRPNNFAQDLPELARVVDLYNDGSHCDGGVPRKSYVHLQCCSEKVMQRSKGMLHRSGHPIQSDVVSLLDVTEDKVCSYNVTLCTPLLCGDPNSVEQDSQPAIVPDDHDADDISRILSRLTSTPNEDESIRDILDRTLSKVCLQTNPGGWWTYEVCHKGSVRQFHEVAGVRRAGNKVAPRTLDSQHILGRYDASVDEHVPDSDEYTLVVNATTLVNSNKQWGEGNGAYYEIEYTGGDVCDDSDVTDSAVVAGTSGARYVERSSSVRFYCGAMYDVQVNEDTTCHYVVNVKVPDLCRHPLFKAPVSKKQVIKCLPV